MENDKFDGAINDKDLVLEFLVFYNPSAVYDSKYTKRY